jgi:hypothetical protein
MRLSVVGQREFTRPDVEGLLLIGSTSLIAISVGSLLLMLKEWGP